MIGASHSRDALDYQVPAKRSAAKVDYEEEDDEEEAVVSHRRTGSKAKPKVVDSDDDDGKSLSLLTSQLSFLL